MAHYISSSTATVTDTAANAVTGAVSGDVYELQSNDIAFWFSTHGTASAEGANCVYVPSQGGVEVRVGGNGGAISLIRAGSTNGKVTVSKVSC